ncbi:MAG: class I SAM-dependent methyltransferase [Jatrophihabitans sp.]
MTDPANPLQQYFAANSGRLLHKWHHYFDIYHRHLAKFRGTPISLLEIGVFHGGSLHMWRDYLGPSAHIIGVDVDSRCAALADARAEVVIGDQEDRSFLTRLCDRAGPFDVTIDDGGHTMSQQVTAFDVLWPAVRESGIYLVEDRHTNYWPTYGGGLRREGTFIELTKRLVDQVNAWHSKDPSFTVDSFTRSVSGLHIYDSIVVLDKASVQPPRHSITGIPSFDDDATNRFLTAQRAYEESLKDLPPH